MGLSSKEIRISLGAGAVALLLAGCGSRPEPVHPGPLQPTEQKGSGYLIQVAPLLLPTSEAELWSNIQKIHELGNSMYCDSFPGCLKTQAPTLKILDTEQYAALVQADDPNHSPILPSELEGAGLTTLRNGDILLNSGLPKVRYAIEASNYSGIAREMPTFLIHERFHADAVPATIPVWGITSGNGTDVNFDQVGGFSLIDTKQSIHFDFLEEAAAVFISEEVQRRQFGTVLGQDMTIYGPYVRLLEKKMGELGITPDTLIAMHRTSSLDDFMSLLYPQGADVVERRILLMNEFDQVG